MKKELYIFMGIFLFLATLMHFKEWTTYPIDQIVALPSSGAYGLGAIHPLIFTFVVYLLCVLIRGVFRGIKKVVGK